MESLNATFSALESIKRTSKNGGEYWRARDIQSVLGYTKWENFHGVVIRAAESCKQTGIDVDDHFLGTKRMMEVGKGAQIEVEDFLLTRYACYLVAMNGDPQKQEVASAQRYFAVQTRERELDQKAIDNQERLRLRGRLTEATKHLNSTAKKAGVQNYAFFASAGYRGLYAMGLSDIKRRKGIGPKEDLFSCVRQVQQKWI